MGGDLKKKLRESWRGRSGTHFFTHIINPNAQGHQALTDIGFKWQKPAKNYIRKFVKLTCHTFACNSLTKFRYTTLMQSHETKIMEICRNSLEKSREITSEELIVGCFIHVKPLCDCLCSTTACLIGRLAGRWLWCGLGTVVWQVGQNSPANLKPFFYSVTHEWISFLRHRYIPHTL